MVEESINSEKTIEGAYEELCDFWARMWKPYRSTRDTGSFDVYERWARCVRGEEVELPKVNLEKPESFKSFEGKEKPWLLFHPDDLAAMEQAVNKGKIRGEQLVKFALEVYQSDSKATVTWPNVPQHFKGDPRVARVITVLMNPYSDVELSKIKIPGSAISADLRTYSFKYPAKPLADDLDADEADRLSALLKAERPNFLDVVESDYSQEFGAEDYDAIRVREQAEVLRSQSEEEFFWWNWLQKHTILKEGFALESFFEIERVPYQTKKWDEKHIPKAIFSGDVSLPSSEAGDNLLRALAADTVRDGGSERIMVLRGTGAVDHYLSVTGGEDRARNDIVKLAGEGRVFQYVSNQGRWVSMNNLRQTGKKLKDLVAEHRGLENPWTSTFEQLKMAIDPSGSRSSVSDEGAELGWRNPQR